MTGPYLRPGMTPEELTTTAREMVARRWCKTNARERSAFARAIAIHPTKERCPCGAMTLRCAQVRADKKGKGIGHLEGCPFYRRNRHPQTRRK